MAIELGDAILRIKGDTSDVEKLSERLGAGMRKAGIAMTAIGAGITAVLGKMVTSYATAGDEVQKMALKTGISTEALSELRHAAELSGTTLDGLGNGIKRMQRFIVEASDGTATYTDVLDKLGITYAELEGLKPEDQFLKLTGALADVEDATLKAGLAQELFGRSGVDLLPMLAEGSAGLEKMRQEAHELGIVFDQEAANEAAKFNDDILRLKKAFAGASMEIVQVLMPTILDLIEWMKEAIIQVREWIVEHPILTSMITKVVAVLGVLMVALGPVLIALPSIIALFTSLGSIVTVVSGIFAAIAAVGVGPIALVVAGVIALIAIGKELIEHWEGIKKWFSDWWEQFKEGWRIVVDAVVGMVTGLWEKVEDVFGWIGDKIMGTIDWLKQAIGLSDQATAAAQRAASAQASVPAAAPTGGGESPAPAGLPGGILPGAPPVTPIPGYGPISVEIGQMSVRSEADIQLVASELFHRIKTDLALAGIAVAI